MSQDLAEIRTAEELLDMAREAHREYVERMEELGRVMRHVNRQTWHQVDAYVKWDGSRDLGMGMNMGSWFELISEGIDDAAAPIIGKFADGLGD